MTSALYEACRLLFELDPRVLAIVLLSLQVSLSALVVGASIGLPLAGLLARYDIPGRQCLIVISHAWLGLPSVIVGVMVYLLLSRDGPLGTLGWLFSPYGMILAQTLLVIPVVLAIARQVMETAWREYAAELTLLRLSPWQSLRLLMFDCRVPLGIALITALGRALSEVGAVMMVGGNIDGYTRVLTTAIALETSKGNLELSLALGIVLMVLVVVLNILARFATIRFDHHHRD